MPTPQFPAVIRLSNLNGQNGFKLDGEIANDVSGCAVSGAGDVNGDGYADFLIGAWNYPTGGEVGRTYVVYGSPNVGQSGLVLLSALNGTNGLIIDGILHNGFAVSGKGDFNGDNYNDILIGNGVMSAYTGGYSYLVYGGSSIGQNGLFSLTNLNGTNGFKFGDTFGFYNTVGYSVSLGDINKDGKADALIGVPSNSNSIGMSYVIFGGLPSAVGGAPLLSNLANGTYGFKMVGELNSDSSGYVVKHIGDVNYDSAEDFFIGAPDHAGGTHQGRGYVIYGGSNIGKTGLISLSALNKTNGFIIDGETPLDYSSLSATGIGDVSGDGIDDFMIGAPQSGSPSNGPGISYVIYGTTQLKSSLALSNINGSNGFKLIGEYVGDHSGWSISSAGDFNGDGYKDLLIGAPNRNRCYVVFGNLTMGANGMVNLTDLNGINGFKIDNEPGSSPLGYSVSLAGDVNGDHIDDLVMGAYAYGSSKGRSYVLYGDNHSPQLSLSPLAIHSGERLIFNNQQWNATDTTSLPKFTISNILHGRFEFLNATGQAITTFSQTDIAGQQVAFVHDGSQLSPNYTVQAYHDVGFAVSPFESPVITFYRKPAFINNGLSINQGQSVLFSSSMLSVLDDYPANAVNFTITNLQHGGFQLLPQNISVVEFTEQQILSGQIYFTQDGSSLPPSYQVTLNDPYYTSSATAANVIFYRKPVLMNNQLSIQQAQSVVMTTASLSVMDDYLSNQVVFTVTNVQHGQFSFTTGNTSITSFTEQQLLAGQVLFAHDKGPAGPHYQVGVSDSYFTLPPVSANITFTPLPPTLIKNQLPTFQGKATILTPASLSAVDPDPTLPLDALRFSVSNVRYGQFNTVQNPGVAITNFTQAQIIQNAIEFTQDNTNNVPRFDLMLSDGRLITGPFTGNVSFDAIPTLLNNRLTIAPGDSVVIAPTNIRAIDDVTSNAELVFSVINIQHGYFSFLQNSNTPILQFTQQNVTDAELIFVHDGSLKAPSYFLTVTDNSSLTTQPQKAEVTFELPLQPTNSNTVRNAIIGGVVSGVVGIGFFVLKFWLDYKAKQYMETALAERDGVAKQQAEFHKNVIDPIVKKILDRIRFSQFMGYISDETTKGAVEAISGLVHAIQKQGVEVDLRKLETLDQNRLLNVIAGETRRLLVPEISCCSMTSFSRLFCPEITPLQVKDKTPEIASAVKEALMTTSSNENHVEMVVLQDAKEHSTRVDSSDDLSSPSNAKSKNYSLHLIGGGGPTAIERRLEGIESQMEKMNHRLSTLESKPLTMGFSNSSESM